MRDEHICKGFASVATHIGDPGDPIEHFGLMRIIREHLGLPRAIPKEALRGDIPEA